MPRAFTRSCRRRWPRPIGLLTASVLLIAPSRPSGQAPLQPTPATEVRQIVTFRFEPGRLAEAMAIYEQHLKPIYQDVEPLLRFRAYREAESPEPLDLVVVSSYQGMSGMDAANRALRSPHPSGQSALQLYGDLSAMTATHHDQFVEMLPSPGRLATDDAGLTVFEYIRVAPGGGPAFERLIAERLQPFEQQRRLFAGSETGRLIVADGWDYLRLHAIGSLADWHAAVTAIRSAPFQAELTRLVAARKTLILRLEPRLSVR